MNEKDGHCRLGEMVHEGLEVLKNGRYGVQQTDVFKGRETPKPGIRKNAQAAKKGRGTPVKLFDTGYGNPTENFK